MSLYYDAASVLSGNSTSGSLKSIVYNTKSGQKSKPAHIYALIAETTKYDILLKEVIENAGILALEPKLTPLLSLLLVHDQLLSKKKEVAAPTGHPLRQAIERHKARLQAEFTKTRLRRKCATVEDLKARINEDRKAKVATALQVRWVRVNRLKSTLEEQLASTFHEWKKAHRLQQVVRAQDQDKVYFVDQNIPDLLAVPISHSIHLTPAYREGEIILQDKASCFPAYLLLGDLSALPVSTPIGDVVDGCAAPGNKTTHLASLFAANKRLTKKSKSIHQIFACERDTARSRILSKMVSTAGGQPVIQILANQDFLALSPTDSRFANVTHLLLDPSCSGSGIIGREDVPMLSLPTRPHVEKPSQPSVREEEQSSMSRKRKRGNARLGQQKVALENISIETNTPADTESSMEFEESRKGDMNPERLSRLANLQSRIVTHALSFPEARVITYSTCSIHYEENEGVVLRVLRSDVARQRGWRVLRKEEQVAGMRIWGARGIEKNSSTKNEISRVGEISQASRGDDEFSEKLEETENALTEEERQACIRCTAGDENATMGFFVCAFLRDDSLAMTLPTPPPARHSTEEPDFRNGNTYQGNSKKKEKERTDRKEVLRNAAAFSNAPEDRREETNGPALYLSLDEEEWTGFD